MYNYPMMMRLARIASGTFQATLLALPFIMGFCFGYEGAFIALLVLAAVAGIAIGLDEGLLSPYRLQTMYPKIHSILQDTKFFDFFGALAGAPVVLSVIVGAGVLAFRCFAWLTTATWPHVTLQGVLGRPTAPNEIATGLLGLDKIIWTLVGAAPLELLLILVFPLIWFAVIWSFMAVTRKIAGPPKTVWE